MLIKPPVMRTQLPSVSFGKRDCLPFSQGIKSHPSQGEGLKVHSLTATPISWASSLFISSETCPHCRPALPSRSLSLLWGAWLWHGWRPYSAPLGSAFIGRNPFRLRFSLWQCWPDPAAPHHCWEPAMPFPPSRSRSTFWCYR